MEKFIQNADLLIGAFGKFPSFHDAEVAEIKLQSNYRGERNPMLSAAITITNYSTNDSYLITLIFESIFGLKLENFNHQNVLGDLIIEEFSDEFFNETKKDARLRGVVSRAETERLKHYVKFEYCFGVEAEFLCGKIVVESVTPFANS